MPLQLRRGTTANRLSITPLVGELIYDTTEQKVYVGNGATAGGLPVTSFSGAESRTETAKMFLGESLSDNSIHTGVTFQVSGNRLIVTGPDLSDYKGLIVADQGFQGNLWGDDSGVIVNSETHTVYGNFVPTGHILPDTNEAYDIGSVSKRFKDLYLKGTTIYLGNAEITSTGTAVNLPVGSTVGGQPVGINEGTTYAIGVQGNVVGLDSTVLVNSNNGTFHGDLYGSVFAADSSMLVDAQDGVLRGELIGNVTGIVTGSLVGNASSASVATTVTLTASNALATTQYPVFVDSDTGNENLRTDLSFTYVPSTNTLTVQTVNANLTGSTATVTTLYASTIDTTDSSAITVIPNVTFNTAITAENDLFVGADFLPVNSETSDIGSFSKKYRKLYLAEGSNALWIGNVALSVSGSVLDLPAGTTVGGSSIALTAGTNALTVTVNTNTTNSAFYIPYFDGLGGNRNTYVDANLNYNPSTNTLVTDNITANLSGNVTGNVTGDTTGYHTGDVKGSIFGNDSSLLVDAVSGIIPASVVSGNANNLTGLTSTGQIITSNDNNSATPVLYSILANNSSATGSTQTFRRSRGTIASPTTIVSNDYINYIIGSGYDGSSYVTSTSISSKAVGTISSGAVPGQLEFATADATGTLNTRLVLDNLGIAQFTGSIRQIVNTYSGTSLFAINQYHSTADSVNYTFARGRGSFLSPTTNSAGDEIAELVFTGTNSSNAAVAAAAITVTIPDTPTSQVTSKITIAMNNGTSAADRFILDYTGVIDHKQTALDAGPSSGQVDTSSILGYYRVKVNGVEVAVPYYGIRP